MKEILNKLLESNVLTEETRTELEAAITEAVQTAVTTAREEAIVEAQANVATQWEAERTALIEAIDTQITEAVGQSVSELNEAKEQLENLKVDLSKRYVQREQQLSESVKNELGHLVEDLDTFMKQVVEQHMAGVTADLKKIKEDNFGRRIFQAFAQEFVAKQYGTDEMKKVTEATKASDTRLTTALQENATLRGQLDESNRQTKLKELLTPLTGEKRKIMEAVLASVPANKLDESYKTYLSRVLRNSEKEVEVLAEGSKKTAATPAAKKAFTPKGVTASGDDRQLPTRSTTDQLNESKDPEGDASIVHLQRMAGIRKSN